MSTLTDLLDEIQDRADRATEGPGEAYSVPASRREAGYSAVEVSDTEVQVTRDAGSWFDADFIARARDDVPRLVAALRGVLATHQEDTCKCCQRGTACRECRAPWPCPTVRAITEALGVES